MQKQTVFPARFCLVFLEFFLIAENEFTVLHAIDDRQAGDFISLLSQFISAFLKALLNRNSDSGNFSACLAADVQQTVHCFSGSHKIIDDQNLVGRPEIFL